jgi:hypothetical protein
VAGSEDEVNEAVVIDLVRDSVVAGPDARLTFATDQLLCASRAGSGASSSIAACM